MSAVRQIESPQRRFLHVGCGPKTKAHTTPDFATDAWQEIRLDIDTAVVPDIVGTMTDMRAVESGSVDAVFSSHNIEHLYPHEVPVALKEFHRVIKADGFVVITCPDLRSVCQLVVDDKLTDAAYESSAGPISPLDMLYGHLEPMSQGNLYMAHRTGFTQKSLRAALLEAGFTSLVTMCIAARFELWAVAMKSPTSTATIEALAAAHVPGAKSFQVNRVAF